MGTVENKPAAPDVSDKRNGRRGPSRGRYSLAVAILTFGFVIVAIILAGVYAYHRLLKTPEELAKDVAKAVASGIKEFFNVTPRVTVNQVVVIHESYPSFELATVTRETTATYEYRNQHYLSEKSLTLKGRFRIKGGFDLSQTSDLEVQPRPLKIIARFPQPKILSVELLSQEVEKSENGYWNKLTPADQKEALDMLPPSNESES